jgi:adenine-specific DNA-methyltransferase
MNKLEKRKTDNILTKLDAMDNILRLNYIGSKFQLINWLVEEIKEKTGWTSFENKRISDLFAGTGVISYYFRQNNAIVVSNDAELYSSIISHAFNQSTFTKECENIINILQTELDDGNYSDTYGTVTKEYSPYEESERMFFTIDNAKRIDYLRERIEVMKECISENEYMFLLASLIIAADSVSNVPAVYGCYLKKFKTKADKSLKIYPIHKNTVEPNKMSKTYNKDVLDQEFLTSFKSDIVYLDPPYNERQYSKNYFPLNIIAKTPEQLKKEEPLRGKTGIPSDCFLSLFCRKREVVEAFDNLIKNLNTKWIFISYNSESIVTKEKMMEILSKYGNVSVTEMDYRRFKSFEYNNDVSIKEYIFCLEKMD